MKTPALYKTTIIIWSHFNPDMSVELEDLVWEATEGSAYCSGQKSELIEDPTQDPQWDGTEFFEEEEEEEEEEDGP